MGFTNNHNLSVVHNFPSQLVRSNSNGETIYTLKQDSYSPLIPDANGSAVTTGAVGVSSNGRWIVAEVMGVGLIKMDTATGRLQLFSNYKHSYGVGSDARIRFVISDNGKYIATFDYNIQPKVYALSDSCGLIADSFSEFGSQTSNFESCPDDGGRLQTALINRFGMQEARSMVATGFNYGADTLTFAYDINDPDTWEWTSYNVPLRSGGYQQAFTELQYLALGDSISSGEGDTEKNNAINQKYYRAGTDINGDANNGIPREKCHISTRSYPYFLASWMQFTRNNPKQWDTVACSGATIYDANQANKVGYEGQWSGEGNPGLGRLYGLTNKDTLKEQALNEMIPGRNKQIEFVEKYKPKVITLTMGGNDVGFGKKIQDCLAWTNTCGWVDADRQKLGGQIKGQFDRLVGLYTELKNAGDPNMKVYTIGYPQFITDAEPAHCGGNIGFLDLAERQMIVQATDYMNDVIEAAANKAGVKYIDTSDALNGGRLCDEGQKYVTGVAFRGDSEIQESFHPNDYGHIKIAQKIKTAVNNESLLTYSQYPTSGDSTIVAPSSSDFATTINSANTDMITQDKPAKGSVQIISVLPYTLKPNSSVHVEVHSKPVSLGDFTAGSDGSLTENVTIPSTLSAGYHTLVLSGETYSGEPIELTQTVLVIGTDSNDLDDNGTPDAQQSCGAFITLSAQDADYDGIDDACDPQITDPILYAARNGDTTLGEDPQKLYLFRNTLASSLTGITGDYVDTSISVDNKEALVASSLDAQTEGIFSKFVMLEDENDPNTKIPTILAKDQTGVCFALQATDFLSPALNPTDPSYQPRGFTKLTQLPEGESCE